MILTDDLLPTNCWSVFDHFVGITLKALRPSETFNSGCGGYIYLNVSHYRIINHQSIWGLRTLGTHQGFDLNPPGASPWAPPKPSSKRSSQKTSGYFTKRILSCLSSGKLEPIFR